MTNKTSKLKKQLAAAIAMVLVAALALGTATFAWFVNNNKVTAKGMTVNAQADTSLLIAGKNDNDWKDYSAIGTTTVEATTLKPATSQDGKYFARLKDTVKVTSATKANAVGSGTDDALTGNDLETAVEDTNYIKVEYSLKSQATDQDVYVSAISVTGADKQIDKSVRVAVEIDDTTYIFNPNSGALVEDLLGKSTDGSTWTVAAADYATLVDTNKWSLTADTPTTAYIYVWFEGQDTQCFTDNISTTDLAVTVDFQAIATTP
ncbi:MAG: hypothetical protein Q4B73_01285 [Lachnospiraceae bacterium]|nr:hypothetical protein [Lachnospiraceae bacterium]